MMFVRNAVASILTIGSLSRDALAEVITITRYPSTCSAIYITGTRSVTIVQSTITVVPVPYDDAAWNGGTPFVLEIEPDGLYTPLNSRDVPQRSWLTLNGNTSTNPLSAGQYKIRSGQLVSVNGSYISTDLNIQSQPFAIAPSPGTISTTFTFKDGVLNWTSPRFTNGRAQFYKLPVGLIDNAQVLAKFIGPMEPQRSWTPIALRARPCDEVNPLSSTSSGSTGTVRVSSSITLGSMSSGPPNQYTSQSPPPYSASTGQTSKVSSSVSSSVPSQSPPPYSDRPVSSSSSRTAPSVSTPYSTTMSYILTSPTTPISYGGPSSSSSSRGMQSVSTPAGYTATTSSSVSSSRSTSMVPPQSSSSRASSSSSTAYTRTSSSPMDSSSSSGPPIYGSQTPSVTSSSSVPTSYSITFASSGSPIGPINPSYERTSSSSNSSTSSMSMSSGGARSTTSASSTSSSGEVPPSYTSRDVSSSSTVSSSRWSSTPSSTPPTSSTSSTANSPPGYTVSTTPSSSGSSSWSSSASSSVSSSVSVPPTYPDESTTSGSSSWSSSWSSSSWSSSWSSSSSPSPSASSMSSPPAVTTSSTSSSAVLPPIYTGSPQPCPEGNNSVYIDTAGNSYTIYCSMDSEPGSYAPPRGGLDFAACIQACDFDPQCGAVVNLNNDVCYFKPTPTTYVPGGGNLAVRLAGPPIYPDLSSTSSWSSSWSSTVSSSVPPQMTTTTTTTSSSVGHTSSSVSSSPSSSPDASSSSSASPSASSSSSTVPDEYDQETTTTTTTTKTSASSSSSSSSSEMPLSTSSEVPEEYDQTTTTTTTTSSDMITTTTTTTTTSSSSSSTAASTTSDWRPYSEYLVLPSPTPCDFGGPPNQANDDDYCELDLPFDMTLYGTTARRTYPSINGYISLNRGSSQFLAKEFPYPGTNFPDNVLAAFFDDLYMYGNLTTRQGIWYQIEGTKVTYEYYVARPMLPSSIYHFTVAYDSVVPNVFTYRYYEVGSPTAGDTGTNGAVAFVGMQGLAANNEKKVAKYSWRQTDIEPGLMVVCNGIQNSCIGALP